MSRNPELLNPEHFYEPGLWLKRQAQFRKLELEAFAASLDSGYCDWLDSAGHTLVSFRLADPAFGDPDNGMITSRPVDDAVAMSDGVATRARLYCADHRRVMRELVAGTDPSAELLLESTNIVAGNVYSLTSLTYHAWTPDPPPQ